MPAPGASIAAGPLPSERTGGSDSASRMTASSVCTASNRKRAGRRLAGQHDRIGALVDSIGRVADLGAGRPWLDAHRLEHLCRHDAGRPSDRARPDDLLLHARHLLERHLETEISARDHHALREPQDGVEVLDRRRTLDLGDDRCSATSLAR